MSQGRMFWGDLETTGLDVAHDVILQVGIAVTDSDLNVLDQREWYFKSTAIQRRWDHLEFHAKEFEESDYTWPYRQHTETGLWEKCQSEGVSPAEGSEQITLYLEDMLISPQDPMCGSSVHFDRAFLKAHLPRVEKMFGYRNIDISTIKELAKRWNPATVPTSSPRHQPVHLAQNDLLNTLDEARSYRDQFLRLASSNSVSG